MGHFFAKPEIVFFDLIWLMYLVVVGTLAQRYIGLYQSQAKYFSSWVFLEGGFFPLPGGYTALTLLFVGLLCKLVFKTPWTWKRFGINVVHVGALLLLFGGFLTALFSQEGGMTIAEGETVTTISSYDKLELVVTDISSPSRDRVTVFGEGWFKKGALLQTESLPFVLKIIDFCRNCDVLRRESLAEETVTGFLKNFTLKAKPLEKKGGDNRAGIIFDIAGKQYALLQWMPISQKIREGGRTFIAEIRPRETRLPFSIHLNNFEKKSYPGTEMAKSFKSIVTLKEGAFEQNSVIWMNHPLRYRDYTFYQASFIEGIGNETTVLAVVKNAGRVFPYLSSLVMCIGLLLHLLLKVPERIRRRK